MSIESLGYLNADVLGIDLYCRDKKIWGAGRKPFSFNVWDLSLWMEVRSDIVTEKEIGMFIKSTSRLHFYLVTTSSKHELYVFDAKGLELSKIGGVSTLETITALGNNVKAIYSFWGKEWTKTYPPSK